MFCSKCGQQLPDGSKFCSACGTKLSVTESKEAPAQIPSDVQTAAAVQSTPDVQDIPEVQDTPEVQQIPAQVVPEFPVTADVPVNNTPVAEKKPGFTLPKKIQSNKTVLLIAAAAVVGLAAILGLIILLTASGSDNAYAYVSDGRYELITNLKKGESVEIASSKSDYVTTSMLSFSPDGKYVYYYTKYDSYYGTGSLCKAEYGKLKGSSLKNDKYIEILATNVRLGFTYLDDGSLLYKNGEDTLYYYDGEDPHQIAKNVKAYYTDDADRLLYTTGDSQENFAMYGVLLSDIDNKTKIVSNYYDIYSCKDFDNILYTRMEDDSSETLYSVGFDKAAEKICEDVYYLGSNDEKFYYSAPNGTQLDLSQYVEDTYAEADSKIVEPVMEDYSVPEYAYERVSGSNLSESDFDELYTSCTRTLYWYGESNWWCYSMEDALELDWDDNNAGIHAATQDFIDKFASSADEDGYIRVTPEVKEALLEIQKYADEPEKEWQWMWLCYNKYQSGTTTDYDSYNAAYDKWYEADCRNEIRQALLDPETKYITVDLSTLYCYENGTATPIHDNVIHTRLLSGGILFNTPEMITEKLKLEEMYSAYDIEDLFDINTEAENYIVLTKNASVCRMSADAAETYTEAYAGYSSSLFFTDKEALLSESNGALSIAPINGNVIGDFAIITDDAEILSIDDSTTYYISSPYQSSSATYCDLYAYSNGSSTRLARDVLPDCITLYDDGVILAYTGYRSYSGYELTMFNAKGEPTIISDNVTQYIRVDDSTVMYISDGDLYTYDGKERELVKSAVDCFWSQNAMEIHHVFGNSYYGW